MSLTLYFSSGACSLAPHIVLKEAGLPHTLIQTDLSSGKTSDGGVIGDVNPKGYVPVLRTADGETITEVAVIVQYLGDLAPEKGLIPAHGTPERRRVQETLNYVATELHKQFSPLFSPTTPDATRETQTAYLKRRLGYINGLLADRPFIQGNAFTVADAYLFTVTNWHKFVKLDISELAHLTAYQARIAERPAVAQAISDEKRFGR